MPNLFLIPLHMYFKPMSSVSWAVTPDVDSQRCASRLWWHIYQPALGNSTTRLVRNMDLCSEHPVPSITSMNKNSWLELPVLYSWNRDYQTHIVAVSRSNGSGKLCPRLWQSKAAKDRENTSSNREICSSMGQEEKGSAIFTEHHLNTTGGGKKKKKVLFSIRGVKSQ